MIVVVMGVSGSGKSTVGAGVASALGWPFEDGDDLHPPANVAKMASGRPLTDEDRAGWLAAVRRFMDGWAAAGADGVVACSALRRAYRDALRGPGDVRFVLLDVAPDVLAARLARRRGHFMPAALLSSQLATLERPAASERDSVIVPVGVETASDEVIAAVLAALGRSGARPDVGTV